MKFKTLFYIFLFNVICLPAQTYKQTSLTADNGLSRNFVDQIFCDSRGFMWFSTANGLDRYDGYEFIHFNSKNKENPLISDFVHCVQEDKNGDMWIGTENGLYFLSFKSGIITNVANKLKINPKIAQERINYIASDEQQNLWIGYASGVVKLNFTEDEISLEEVYNSKSAVSAILIQSGNIVIGSGKDVFGLLKKNTGNYQRIDLDKQLLNLNGLVSSLFNDNETIWIGTNYGLYKYDTDSENLTLYTTNASPGSLTSNNITDIRKNKEGQLLIGTLIGLNFYNYRTDSFSSITSEKNNNQATLTNNFVNCLYADGVNIWVGTDKGGVNILTPEQGIFTNIYNLQGNPNSLSRNPVNAIYEDSDGDIWVGTVEGGLNLKKKGTDGFVHYYSNSSPNSLSHNSISVITQDYNGDYWFGTWGLGLNKLLKKDKKNPIFKRFPDTNSNNGPQSNLISALISDKANQGIWVGTNTGVDFFDLNTGKFRHILKYLPASKQIRDVAGMYIDSKRRLWIGTDQGLYCILLNESDLKRNKLAIKHYLYQLSTPSSGIIERINCILETKDHKLWFGSFGNGIYMLNEDGEKVRFVNYDEKFGLLDDVVYQLLEDETGNIWMSTDKGICVFNAYKNSIRSYNKSDGLISNQFYWNASLKADDGKMYFGNILGMTMFEPLKSNPLARKNSPSITRIKILNDDVFPAKVQISGNLLKFEGTKLKRLRLLESDKSFSIEFSALTYTQADKIKYAYRLKGFDNNWTEVNSDRRFANFTNIGSGNYMLEVKCTNPDGTWSDQLSTLEIRVVPPFYKSFWFILFIISALVYGGYRLIMYRIRLLKEQEIHLKQLVDERTQKIDLQNKKLERQAKQVEDATVDKIAFFTNITHEFRTPITLIVGPVERALKLSTNPLVIEQLNIVKRNSRLLLSLINQLMDFRKIESDKMELSKAYHDFIEFMDDLLIPFEDLAKERGIDIAKQYRIVPPELFFDRDSMQKVVSNLLSNAVKFTPDKGHISVSASTYTDKTDQKEKLYVAVKNTGRSIPEEELDKIFERFYQSKQLESYSNYGQSGTGIGLFLCKRLIELNNGRIEAVNVPEGGVSFRFILPIEKRTLSESESRKPVEVFSAEKIGEDEMLVQSEIIKSKPILLIVEDNQDMREYIRSLLIADYNIIEASNGLVGLEATNRYQPDIILSDVMMPEMDGIEFSRQVKSNFTTSHIPIILLTAKSATDTQIESYKIGVDAYLVKPFDESLLKAVIKNLNEKRNKLQNSFAEKMDSAALDFAEESQDKKFIDKALDIIKDNYTNPDFDVTEFIDAMAISRSLLHKKLTNLAGQSASRFIRTYRLNMARELLIKNRASHSQNISEIAYQVGFNDPKYFTRCFTKQFGIQPSAFMDEKI